MVSKENNIFNCKVAVFILLWKDNILNGAIPEMLF
jgi:hypothetical protein